MPDVPDPWGISPAARPRLPPTAGLLCAITGAVAILPVRRVR